MAEPDARTSITSGIVSKARTTTFVSSQSDMFSGNLAPPAKAWMMRARLLMLFEGGNATLARSLDGAFMVYCNIAACILLVVLLAKITKIGEREKHFALIFLICITCRSIAAIAVGNEDCRPTNFEVSRIMG